MHKLIIARNLLASVATLALLASASTAFAAQKHRRAQAAQGQIACTVDGCIRVPPGCGQIAGRTWDDTPTGYDVIVCPAPRPVR